MNKSEIKRILAIALLLVVVISLFFNWIVFDISPGLMDQSDFVSIEHFRAEYTEMLRESMTELQSGMAARGVYSVDVTKSMDILGKTSVGLSPFNLGRILNLATGIMRPARSAPGFASDNYFNGMEGAIFVVTIAMVAYNVLFYLILVMVAVTVLLHLCGRRYRGWAPFPALLFLVILFVGGQIISQYFVSRDLVYNDLAGEHLTRLTAWPFIAFAAFIAAMVLWLHYIREVGPQTGSLRFSFGRQQQNAAPVVIGGVSGVTGIVVDGPGWQCPACNAANENRHNFCAGCGAPRTASPKTCAQCGSALAEDAVFCAVCGSPISGA